MKTKWISMMALAFMGLAACTNDGSGRDGDRTETTSNATEENGAASSTSSNDYAAMADEFDTNSEAKVYLDPRTGKSRAIKVDRTSGRKTWADSNEPVDYYVDSRTWWVYDPEGSQLAKARMEKETLEFENDNSWVPFSNFPWKSDEDGVKREVEKDGDTKTKYGEDMKVKTEKDGDVKIKMGDKKIKKDEDGIRVKDDK